MELAENSRLKIFANNTKYRWIGCLLIYALIIILPPIIHGYVYPNQGDDSAYHLAYFEGLQNGEEVRMAYPARMITGYAIVGISNLTGLTIDTVFLWFNYLTLVLIGLSIFTLISYVSDWKGGLLAIPLVIFTSMAVLFQFNAGAIFGLITIGIFYPLCLTLILYAVKKNKVWLWLLTGMLSIACLIPHAISIFGRGSYSEPIPSIFTFGMYLTGIVAMVCLPLVAYFNYTKRVELTREQAVFVILSGTIALVLGIITFVGLTSFSSRMAWYLAIVVTLLTSGLIGIFIKQKVMPKLVPVFIVIIMGVAIPQMVIWFGNNTAIKDVDLQAIEYINKLPGEYYSVSPEVAYWIYDRFTDKEYKYGEYPYIERSEPMTFRTNPVVPYYWYKNYEPFYPEGEPEVFENGKVIISVYE